MNKLIALVIKWYRLTIIGSPGPFVLWVRNVTYALRALFELRVGICDRYSALKYRTPGLPANIMTPIIIIVSLWSLHKLEWNETDSTLSDESECCLGRERCLLFQCANLQSWDGRCIVNKYEYFIDCIALYLPSRDEKYCSTPCRCPKFWFVPRHSVTAVIFCPRIY